ncbi:hypothetical protein BaRGS_00038616, partial [Batillaria attramentaria]
ATREAARRVRSLACQGGAELVIVGRGGDLIVPVMQEDRECEWALVLLLGDCAVSGKDSKWKVTMADRSGAERACKDPNPIIDGRKANVNLAYLGAKPRINGLQS